MKTYYAWESLENVTLCVLNRPPEVGAVLLYAITAETWEEAMAIHHLRQGLPPYIPTGEPASCHCGSVYYPSGSGQCWKCHRGK